jgi:hypothetical protein
MELSSAVRHSTTLPGSALRRGGKGALGCPMAAKAAPGSPTCNLMYGVATENAVALPKALRKLFAKYELNAVAIIYQISLQ